MTGQLETHAPETGPRQPVRARAAERRRAWLVTVALALLVLVYLTVWSTYVALHTRDRYDQLAPGASGRRGEAEFRVLSMVRADRLADKEGQDPQVPDPDAVFVVAELEMVQQRPEEFLSCSDVDLLGPGGRRWESFGTTVQRQVAYCDSDDVTVGVPYRFETVYSVPARYVDGVVGVALVDTTTAARMPVLRPPG